MKPPRPSAAGDAAGALRSRTYSHAWSDTPNPALAAFRDWTARYRSATTSPATAATQRDALLAEGVRLARERRPVFRTIMERDPAAALALTVPASVRAALPAEVIAELETRFSARGDFEVRAVDYPAGEAARRRLLGLRADPFEHHLTVAGRTIPAFVYGRRADLGTKFGVPLHGLVLDGIAAVHEHALRVPDADEVLAAETDAAGEGEFVAELAGRILRFPTSAALLAAEAGLARAEAVLGPDTPAPSASPALPGTGAAAMPAEAEGSLAGAPATSWTTGTKQILVIRVDFSDLTGEPRRGSTTYTADYVKNLTDTQVAPFYAQSSYGKTALVTTVSAQVYRMPQTSVYYATGGTSGLNTELHADARAAAAAHHAVDTFDRILVLFSSLSSISGSKITYGGLAQVGAKNSWINGAYDFRVVAHELGHTYGLRHANLWLVTDGNPLSTAGSNSEYGDDFDTMGANFANDRRTDFNPWFKNLLGWVTDAQVVTVTASGTYRVSRVDNASGAGLPALRIPRDGTKSTWVGVRRNFTTNASMQAGAYLIWGYSTASASHLLDLNTPGTSVADAALAPAATLVDTVGNVSIRHAGNGGTAPDEYADIQVTLGLNGLPVFSLQPASQGYDIGATVTLTAAVDGTAPISYQWRKDGADIAGATSLSLVIANAQAAAAGTYTLRASNSVGSAVSNPAILAVNSAPRIASGPANTAATAGRTVTFSVAVTGAPAPTFQWRKNSTPIAGATASTLTFASVQSADAAAGPYDVVVTNAFGSVTSAPAALAVFPAGTPPSNDAFANGWALAGNAGAVVGSNAGATGESGEPVHIGANGTATSVWYRFAPSVTGMAEVDTVGSNFDTVLAVYTGAAVNGLTAIGSDDQSGGLNTSRLRFPVTAGTVYHIAVGDFSSTRAGGNIALRYAAVAPPTITTPPTAVVGTLGGTASFTVAASGSSLGYQWFRNGLPLAGATAATLNLSNLSGGDAGAYFVSVSNVAGTVVSAPVTLSGSGAAPVIVTPPASVSAVAGGAASFSVVATGAAPLSFQWRRNGFPITGATANTLTWSAVSRTDADVYDAIVTSGLTPTTSPPVRLSVAPSAYPGLVAPDPDWELRPEYTGGLGYVVAPASEGRTYIGGSFVSLDGVRRTGIARLAADGTLDPTFVPPEIDHNIRAIVVQPDGKVVIGGEFVRINGLLRHRVARLNPDGSVDATFAIPGEVNNTVHALALAADGRICIGGAFTAFAGTNRNYLARVDASGAVDSGFLNRGMSSTVQALLLQPDGKLVVGGSFTTGFVDPAGASTARSRLARLNADGSLDPAFAPALNNTVLALARQSTGALIVGGSFTTVNTSVNAPYLARFDSTGVHDTAFQAALGSGLNGQVNALATDSAGRVLVGGDFSLLGGSTAGRFVRLTAAGARDTSLQTQGFSSSVYGLAAVIGTGGTQTIVVAGGFSNWLNASGATTSRSRFARLNEDGTLGAGVAFATVRTPGTINGIQALPGGKILVAGFFSALRGATVPTALARLNPDGTVDTTFNAGGSGANSNIYAAAVQPDGRIVVTGFFTTYNSVAAPGIARLQADGTLDSSFNPGAGLSANTAGYALALLPGGRIFVGGNFTAYNGIARNRVAVLLTNGSLDSSWDPGTGASSSVYAAVAQTDGRLVIGGAFTAYNGTTVNRIARLSATGALDTGFASGAAGANGSVLALALRPNQQIAVGGSFGTMHGSNRPGLAVLSADGALDAGFSTVNIQSVYGVIAQEDGKVVARGSFPSAGGQAGSAFLARFKPDGSLDDTFVAGGFTSSSSLPTVPAMGDAGQIWMQSNGATGLSATEAATLPVISVPPKAAVVALGDSLTLSVTVASALPVTYQWLKQGSPISGETGATLARPAIAAADSGDYAVRITSELGTTTSAAVTVRAVTPPGLTTAATLAPVPAGTGSFVTSFYVDGALSDRKPMLVRAVGPALTGLNATGAVSDPRLEILRGSDGAVVAANDNWGTATNAAQVAAAAARLGATPFAADSKDAAVLLDLAPGLYHARVAEAAGFAGGRALLEVFEADATPRLVYFATRAYVGTGADAWTQHINIRLPAAGGYLVRALGPALGVAGALADPYLTVRQGTTVLAENDNWSAETGVAPIAAALGAMPLAAGSKDAALRIAVSGAATLGLSVHGVGGTTGTALVEVFDPGQPSAAIEPVFVVQPEPVAVALGQPFIVGAVTFGRPQTAYQWTKDGLPLIGATGATYSVPAAFAADAGEYRLSVTGSGPQLSRSAAVTVTAPSSPTARHAVAAAVYEPGGTIAVENVLVHAGAPTRLEWSVVLPAGWTLVSTQGDLGAVIPAVGAGGTLLWQWTTLPPNPARFTYTVRASATDTGSKSISASLANVRAGGTDTVAAAPGALVLALSSFHTADTNRDQRIDLGELLRVIQLYNTRNANTRTGAYAVATATTEDGLAPDPDRPAAAGAAPARFHAADTNRDGRLSLVELTRVIELYNHRAGTTRTGQYRLAAGTEDGFAPGP